MWISKYGTRIIDTPKECSDGINYRYINGNQKNRKHCRGYCDCDLHRGCLTAKMITQHSCEEKKCSKLFINMDYESQDKRKEAKRNRKIEQEIITDIIEKSNNAISEEGMKVIYAKRGLNGQWILGYVSIAEYDITKIRTDIVSYINEDIVMEDCKFDFDTAAKIIVNS